jgi:hypothetical protein
MAKLARTLLLAATVAAMNLAGMAATVQASDENSPHPAGAGGELGLLPPGDAGPAGGTEGPDAG